MPNLSDFVRTFPYPVLDEGNLSFPHGEYAPKFYPDPSGSAAMVQHKVNNAALVVNWVRDGQAACGCAVSIPITGYRKFFSSSSFDQKVEWDKESVGQPPFLQPYIVCSGDIKHTLRREDGVHERWIGREIHLEKGSKIAIGPTFRPMSSMQSLLSIEKNKDSSDLAQIRIRTCTDDGFYFKVLVQPELYEFLQQPGGDNRELHCRSILIHAVSCCFSILANEYGNDGTGDEGWRSHANLRILHEHMEIKGLKTWDMVDDFYPEEAATSMWPHRIPPREKDDV